MNAVELANILQHMVVQNTTAPDFLSGKKFSCQVFTFVENTKKGEE